MSLNPQDSQKILLGFILLLIVSIIWSSILITKNPYTYPANFWLNFMMGFVFYIVLLMIDTTTKLQLVNTFQYILIAFTILLNSILISNSYRKFVTIPPNLVTVIVSLNGFMSAYAVSYLLSFNVNNLKSTKTPLPTTQRLTTIPMTTQGMTTMPMTTMPMTTQGMTTMPMTTQGMTTMPMTTQGITTMPMTPAPMTTAFVTQTPMTTIKNTNLPAQLRSLNSDMYDFGAFDLSQERAEGNVDNDYFNDFAAQYRDEEELNYVEDDYVEDDYVEDDYVEDDYIEEEY